MAYTGSEESPTGSRVPPGLYFLSMESTQERDRSYKPSTVSTVILAGLAGLQHAWCLTSPSEGGMQLVKVT